MTKAAKQQRLAHGDWDEPAAHTCTCKFPSGYPERDKRFTHDTRCSAAHTPAEHTPGPWKLVRLGENLYVEAEGVCIADFMRKDALVADLPALEANARLIAQAPRMAEWLTSAVNALRNPDDQELAKDVVREIEAVLRDAGFPQ